jgi:hypothetical protein
MSRMQLWHLLLVIGAVFGGLCILMVVLGTALKRAGVAIPGGFSEVLLGLGRIVALYDRSSTAHHIR